MRSGADRTLELLESQVGRTLAEVETPVAVVDLDRLEANLRDLQSYADAHEIALWPHTKTHKSPEIGLRQLELGAGGLTVAKTGEAQVFRDAGATRLLVHYPPIGDAKWERLAQLASDGVDLTVAVDGFYAAQGLSAALARRGARATLLVEMDVGLHRTGQTTAAGALDLAQRLSGLPAVEVAGISCYPGHCRGDEATDQERASARSTRSCARRGTPSSHPVCAAIASPADRPRRATSRTRPASTSSAPAPTRCSTAPTGHSSECALHVEVTVISDAVPGQIVIDAGSKTLTSDTAPDPGNGAIVGFPTPPICTI